VLVRPDAEQATPEAPGADTGTREASTPSKAEPSTPPKAEASTPPKAEVSTPRGADPATREAGDPPAPHPVELAGLLHELSVHLLAADDLSRALDRLAVFAAGAVPGVLRCSVTLIADGEPLTLAASGPQAQALDDLQYAIGQGPGLDAARARTLVSTQDLPADPRWPELADCARAQGVHSVAAVPLDVQRSSVGAMTLFVAQPHGIDPDLLLTAMAIVNQAEVLLAELTRREALSEDATVDRAVGVIIAQRGCGVREAYDVLRDTAQRLGMDRRSVAKRLVAAAARNATPH
jgi:hypothetical protein